MGSQAIVFDKVHHSFIKWQKERKDCHDFYYDKELILKSKYWWNTENNFDDLIVDRFLNSIFGPRFHRNPFSSVHAICSVHEIITSTKFMQIQLNPK